MKKLGEVVGEGYNYEIDVYYDESSVLITISDGLDTISLSPKMVKELVEILKKVEK